VERAEWAVGPLEFALYLGPAELPHELVTSGRCVVQVGDQLLACEDAHPSVSVWPGGRREPGESWTQTAVREVAEETGWLLDPTSIEMLGFLHFRHLSAVPVDHAYPNPDFLQVVLHGNAAGGSAGWVDTEGYVLRTTPVDFDAIDSLPVSQAERLAVRAIREHR
jgi:ADP-ribose pyrophosphatase YjhB (NUDIX family)